MTKNELKEQIKNPPRFTIEKASGYAIFDNEGLDDYYHINELEDMTMLVKVINDLNTLKNQFLQRITELENKYEILENIENDDVEEIKKLYLENEQLKEENQKLRELLFDPRRITNEVQDE